MQNDMLMTMHRSKSKPAIEFQYGGRPFSETGSSYISAVDWDISSIFDTLIEFNVLEQIRLLKLKPGSTLPTLWPPSWKIDLTSYLRRRSSYYYEIYRRMQNDMLMTMHRSKSNPEIAFQYGGRPFSKTEVVISQPWIEISRPNLAWK